LIEEGSHIVCATLSLLFSGFGVHSLGELEQLYVEVVNAEAFIIQVSVFGERIFVVIEFGIKAMTDKKATSNPNRAKRI
jgi:uncharacterized protein YsxB (DUF464 family)